MGLFEKLMKWMAEHYARERAVGSLGSGKRWIPRTLLLHSEARKQARTPPIGASGARR
jgi:hypothetical protein